MTLRLSDRLQVARRQQFVGREAERAFFQSILDQIPPLFHILYVYGPGGVGKTSLLREFGEICSGASISFISIDGRSFEPTPISFLETLQRALNLETTASPLEFLASQAARQVLLIDTYETHASLDEWITRDFLPQMPENALVVLASRHPPAPIWMADPGMQAILHTIPLRNLAPDESRMYLARRNIPEEQHQAVLEFTHGHPLALSLVAEVFAQRPGIEFVPEDTPYVVKTLLERFIQKVPGPAHRAALEACSLVRVCTEALLARMLDTIDAHELFDWLRDLTFIESKRGGIFPHDLAREALIADLRWRNPDWYAELHRRARGYYVERFNRTTGSEQHRTLWDLIYLHRDNVVVKPFFEWQASPSMPADVMRTSDLSLLVEMVRLHEGDESARLASYWLERYPQNALILRDDRRQPAGLLFWLELNSLSDTDRNVDPAVLATWEVLQKQAPLRPGETAMLHRYWMARDTYQDVSPIQSVIFVNLVRQYLTTLRLSYTFFPCAEPNFWAPGFAYGDMYRLPEADFQVGNRAYGVFGHDWRVRPPLSWLELLSEREIAVSPAQFSPPQPSQPVVVLSQEEFSNEVRAALRTYAQPVQLQNNPLLLSRLVLGESSAGAVEKDNVEKLRLLLLQAAELLLASPRGQKHYRALEKTYFHPAPTQEIAAELLDLPFSTYRRHLKAGIDHVVRVLWLKEIGQL